MDLHNFLTNELVSLTETEAQKHLLQYYEALKSSPQGCSICCDFLNSDYRDERGTFLCLQVLEHCLQTNFAENENGNSFFSKIKSVTILWYQKCSVTSEKSYIKNKTCQVLVSIFVKEYPQKWPTFFNDVMQHLNTSPQSADLFLRLLTAIHSEAVDRHIPRTKEEEDRNTTIKDTMREQCVSSLVESWFQILQLHSSNDSELTCLCLNVIGCYISWIDINYIVNDRFINVFLTFLGNAELREETCDCLIEIVNKGMDSAGKMNLIELLCSVVEKSGHLVISEDEDPEFICKVANLIDDFGVQLISSWNKLPKSERNNPISMQLLVSIKSKLPYLFRFLSHNDDDVSQAVFDFSHAYLNLLKEGNVRSADDDKCIQEMLLIVIKKMKYKMDHSFDKESEEESLFVEFRKQMKVLFDHIAKLNAELVISTVHSLVTRTMNEWQNVAFVDVELTIYALYLLGETIPGQDLFTDESKFAALQEMLSQMILSNVSCHQHELIILQFFETVARYERFFYAQTQHIGFVLAAFLDQRGLRHTKGQVSSRTSYLFMRFVKAMKNHLQPYVSDILQQLRPLLVVFPNETQFESSMSSTDKYYLYEIAAVLILCANAGEETQSTMMKDLLSPVVMKFTATMEQIKSGKLDELQMLSSAQELQHLIAYLSRSSKAFTSQQALKSSGCQSCFTEALNVVLQSLTLPVHRDIIHTGVRQYLHRMIICLGDDLLPFIPIAVSHLLQDCGVRDIQEFIPLINQLIARYKTVIAPFLSTVFMPIVNGIFSILNSPLDPADMQVEIILKADMRCDGAYVLLYNHDLTEFVSLLETRNSICKRLTARDRQLLHRGYFLIICTLLSNNVTDVLKSLDEENTEKVLNSVIHGAVELVDPQSQKVCFTIFVWLLTSLGTSNEINGLRNFIYSSIIPACFETPLKSTFDLNDAQTVLIVQEIATTLITIFTKEDRDKVINYMESQYLKQLQLPNNVAQSYCDGLRQAKDSKTLKKFLKMFYTQLRQL